MVDVTPHSHWRMNNCRSKWQILYKHCCCSMARIQVIRRTIIMCTLHYTHRFTAPSPPPSPPRRHIFTSFERTPMTTDTAIRIYSHSRSIRCINDSIIILTRASARVLRIRASVYICRCDWTCIWPFVRVHIFKRSDHKTRCKHDTNCLAHIGIATQCMDRRFSSSDSFVCLQCAIKELVSHCACEAIGTCRFHIRLKIQFDGSRCIDLWRRFYLGRRHSFAHTPNNCGVKNGELMAIHTHVKCATSSANLFFFFARNYCDSWFIRSRKRCVSRWTPNVEFDELPTKATRR